MVVAMGKKLTKKAAKVYKRRLTMRLIDADALLEKYNKTTVWDSWVEINIAPTIDAVPVVRCKDCKHAEKSKYAFDWDGKTPLCECSYMTQPNRWHEYCSWAERKEAE